jgi:hypothetical protein
MITYIVYILVILILLFVVYTGIKAFIRGIKAKNRSRSDE